ncbi:MAG TPA: NAD(P)-binding domain-containing protein [Brevundimonas sp.]|jgi:hypothetical protein
MNIAILGKGNMGAPLAELMEKAGHSVTRLGRHDDAVPALNTAALVVLALKYEQVLDLAGKPGVVAALSGKIVLDMTNPLAADYMSLTIGHSTSAAEEIAKRLPDAHVVKAFNTVFAGLLARRAAGENVGVPVFVAGDDAGSVDIVLSLATSIGFEALNGGSLSNARYLEPMAEFMIQLAYGLGHGAEIGFAVVKRCKAR